jgi:hypothetical protein
MHCVLCSAPSIQSLALRSRFNRTAAVAAAGPDASAGDDALDAVIGNVFVEEERLAVRNIVPKPASGNVPEQKYPEGVSVLVCEVSKVLVDESVSARRVGAGRRSRDKLMLDSVSFQAREGLCGASFAVQRDAHGRAVDDGG